ncbi:uncharacterized protein ATNIH1004_010408 [Aspergillus tanneri]|uniref:Myb-like DNA-binding domain-containing protein n=1 Tax=Aspergillus tanneri TaxID=1220188 RepID=A0A5M9MGL9_9EURO|nr:uncharacterized protein ATNIH1004_010408 [Aspergillus tanneri]KAA8643639.1 hypothetical protein ATNIH1004_010408 [Aspergillus tanneri]
MAPVTMEEQFQFLLSCIRFSNSGKIDFNQVAKECSIISKGAAAKRYERLMKAHGINPSGGTVSTPAGNKSGKNSGVGDGNENASPGKNKHSEAKRKATTTPSPINSSPKKARLMKKSAVMCAQDLVEQMAGSEKETKSHGESEDDLPLFDV